MFDEPFNGMDPEGIVWMRGFLASLAAEGRAVLVSSHLMSELQETAGHLVIVGRGKVIADTSVADMIAAASGDWVTVRTSAAGTRPPCCRRRGGGGRCRRRRPHRLRAAGGADNGAARRREGAVLRGVGAPGDPGRGLHGATRDAAEYRAEPATGAA